VLGYGASRASRNGELAGEAGQVRGGVVEAGDGLVELAARGLARVGGARHHKGSVAGPFHNLGCGTVPSAVDLAPGTTHQPFRKSFHNMRSAMTVRS